MIRKLTLLIMAGVLLLSLVGPSLLAKDKGIDIDAIKFPKLNDIKMPDVKRITLDNGIRLYIVEDRSLPLFNVSVRIAGGSTLEPADKIGLANMTATVMRTGGTPKWTGDELDALLEGVGASVETNMDLTECGAFASSLSEFTDMTLEALAEVLRRPVFAQEKIDLEKIQERTNISRRNDDIPTLTRSEFRKVIYGADSPYARQTKYATVDAITRDDMIAFQQTLFQPQNMQMAVWGDFDQNEIVAKIQKYFGDWSRGATVIPPPPKVEYQWRNKVYLINKPDAAQTYVRIGHLGGLSSDPDNAARIVMNAILGDNFGSRLTDNVRTRLGLAYSVGGNYASNFQYPEYFFAYASTNPTATVKATREMITQVRSMLTTPPTPKEMAKGKDGYLNSFVFNFANRAQIVNRIMAYDYYGLPETYLQDLKSQVEQVTPADVQAAARRNLHPDSLVVLVVGKPDQFDEPLTALGMGEPELIDITIPAATPKRELAITPENLQKGTKILEQAVASHGGTANFKKIKRLHNEGTLTLIMQGQEIPLAFVTDEVLPKQSRSVLSFMGRQLYDIRNSDKGWQTDQATGGLIDKTPDDLAKADKELAREELRIFQRVGDTTLKAVYDGEGEVNGTKVAYVAILDDQNAPVCRLGFDAKTSQLVCKEYWGETPIGEGNIQVIYYDFATKQGVTLAMKTEASLEGQKAMVTTYNVYEVNPEVSPDLFNKPQ
jgi:predicted Zn-dependent peptidase